MPSVAFADRYDVTRIFSEGKWRVEHTYDTFEKGSWCSAETANKQNQTFHIVAFESGFLTLLILDPHWALSERSVRFLIDVDYERWFVRGSAEDTGVSVGLNDPKDTVRFLGQLGRSSAVAVYTEREDRLGVFSLRGSQAALKALMFCWQGIRTSAATGGRSDPF